MSFEQKAFKINWSWHSRAFRGIVYQLLTVALLTAAVLYLVHNTRLNMQMRGIQSGWDFLLGSAGFDIGESLFPFDSSQPYWQAYLVGFSNTLRVAVLGIAITTVLGTLIGVGRFSANVLVRGLCICYVEMFRNIPVLLQLLMWYVFLTEMLPGTTEPLSLGHFYLSKGGFNYPVPVWNAAYLASAAGMVAGVVLAAWYRRKAKQRFEQTATPASRVAVPLLIVLAGTFAGWLAGGAPTALDLPVRGEFAVENGAALTPEFMAVLLGLTFYTSAFVAEVVRAGIASVAHGQAEAAMALGLTRMQTMRLVTLPQALRVIIPPMTNQYLNLTKNSSLAVAIGYPDVVSIANTAINQTGRAVECIGLVMLVYLSTSLLTSVGMNWYNRSSTVQER